MPADPRLLVAISSLKKTNELLQSWADWAYQEDGREVQRHIVQAGASSILGSLAFLEELACEAELPAP